jgi:hypothetical protein
MPAPRIACNTVQAGCGKGAGMANAVSCGVMSSVRSEKSRLSEEFRTRTLSLKASNLSEDIYRSSPHRPITWRITTHAPATKRRMAHYT